MRFLETRKGNYLNIDQIHSVIRSIDSSGNTEYVAVCTNGEEHKLHSSFKPEDLFRRVIPGRSTCYVMYYLKDDDEVLIENNEIIAWSFMEDSPLCMEPVMFESVASNGTVVHQRPDGTFFIPEEISFKNIGEAINYVREQEKKKKT